MKRLAPKVDGGGGVLTVEQERVLSYWDFQLMGANPFLFAVNAHKERAKEEGRELTPEELHAGIMSDLDMSAGKLPQNEHEFGAAYGLIEFVEIDTEVDAALVIKWASETIGAPNPPDGEGEEDEEE